MKQQYYEYLAFISYSHEDTKQAEYIHNKLKEYHVPQVISTAFPELSKVQSFNIFRDEEFNGGGMLWKNIAYKIENSKYLIVVCSPNSAKSKKNGTHWVNREVEYFLKKNSPENIIPVIIDGKPDAIDETEQCYCPALRKTQKGLFSFLNKKNNDEFHGINANVLKYKPLEIITREEEDDILGRIKAILLGIDFASYRKYTYSKRYFKDYTDKNGLPFGIYELTEEQVSHMSSHFTFVYRDGILDELREENSFGGCEGTWLHFIYDSQNQLIKIENKQECGNIKDVLKWEDSYKRLNLFDVDSKSGRTKASLSIGYENQESFDLNERDVSNIKSMVYERNSNGFIARVMYHRYHNEIAPVCDRTGIFGKEYIRNDLGQEIEIWNLDSQKNHYGINNGIAAVKISYDNEGNAIAQEYVDINEKPVFQTDGTFIKREYDDNGNLIKISFFDADNKPMLRRNDYVAEIKYKYDEKGNNIETEKFGINGERILCKEGYHKMISLYNDKGLIIEECYFDENGKYTVNPSIGCARRLFKYDDKGNVIKTSYYSDAEHLMLNCLGYAVLHMKYDNNIEIEEECFGINYEPVKCIDGYHKLTMKYDEYGNIIEATTFDEYGNYICCEQQDGAAIIRFKYDELHFCIEKSYYKDNDNLMHNVDDVAIVKFLTDINGNNIETSCYGCNGEPVRCYNEEGYGEHKTIKTFNDRNQCTSISYFDEYGNSIIPEGSIASKVIYKFDEKGNIIESRFYEDMDNLIHSEEHASILRVKYDERGNIIEYAGYGYDEKPYLVEDKFYKMIAIYDENNNNIESYFYDVDNQLIAGKNKHPAILKSIYDSFGHCIETHCYDHENKPVIHFKEGYSCEKTSYDLYGNKIEENYYGTEDEPINNLKGYQKKKYVYNQYGEKQETLYFDKDGNPVMLEEPEDE